MTSRNTAALAVAMTQFVTTAARDNDGDDAIKAFCLRHARGRHILQDATDDTLWCDINQLDKAHHVALLPPPSLDLLALYGGAILTARHIRHIIDGDRVRSIDEEWGQELRLFVMRSADLLGISLPKNVTQTARQDCYGRGYQLLRQCAEEMPKDWRDVFVRRLPPQKTNSIAIGNCALFFYRLGRLMNHPIALLT